MENYQEYLRGARLPDQAELGEREKAALLTCPVWGDMRIVQNNPNSYSVDKRTNPESSWVHVVDGGRALGGALLGKGITSAVPFCYGKSKPLILYCFCMENVV